MEEFKSCIPERIVVYLNEQKVSSLSVVSVLADEFVLTHKNVFTARTEKVQTLSFVSKEQSRSTFTAAKPKEERDCFYCHFHVIFMVIAC